jgi:hypothetical protein
MINARMIRHTPICTLWLFEIVGIASFQRKGHLPLLGFSVFSHACGCSDLTLKLTRQQKILSLLILWAKLMGRKMWLEARTNAGGSSTE